MIISEPVDQAAPLLKLENLSCSYPGAPERLVLRDVNLEVRDGEKFGLVGSNGSGKTTLFRCVTGLSKSAGSIFLNSRRVETEKDFQYLRGVVGYVLQNSDDQLIFPTVMEDLVFGPLNLGLSPEEARARAEETLLALGLGDYGERISWNLSGGEKKLVAIASILVMRPRLILLDEPLNELDEKASARVRETISSLNRAAIVISHDMGFLEELGAKIVRLKDGRLLRE
ncbi:MAG: ABC transporter ATP-binding protein [Desulfovibrio sp.]|nr:ABC transporter ATP-binding protein [Desulfovibrio sp.]